MASKIKIKVIHNESNFKLRLPGIPFWLIIVLCSIALKFKDVAIRNMNNLDEDSKFFLNQLDSKVIRDLIRELRLHGKFDLVDVSTGDGTMVKISIL